MMWEEYAVCSSARTTPFFPLQKSFVQTTYKPKRYDFRRTGVHFASERQQGGRWIVSIAKAL
jgi:hypothetical protein